MKTAFNILPDKNEVLPMHLLIEAGCYGISFIWFKKDPFLITGLAVYNFNKISPVDIAEEIENAMQSNAIFNESNSSTTICYSFKDSLLIPGDYYKASTAAEMLNMVHNCSTGYELLTDRVNGYDSFHVYAVEKKITSALTRKFPAAITYHSASLLLEKMDASATYIHCIIFHNCINVFLFNRGLQFTGQFFYKNPVDAAYHLLNCCQQYDIDPAQLKLELSGMIDANSNLYNELYKYFLTIEFEQPADSMMMHERIKFYPRHFFSHLTRLVSCVS